MFSLQVIARAFTAFGVMACAACVDLAPRSATAEAPHAFYTVTAEIALSRQQPRIAALEYAAAAETSRDEDLLRLKAEAALRAEDPAAAVSSFRAALASTGKFTDDARYYLGAIAERRGEAERALRLYAEVQNGDSSGRQEAARRIWLEALSSGAASRLLESTRVRLRAAN